MKKRRILSHKENEMRWVHFKISGAWFDEWVIQWHPENHLLVVKPTTRHIQSQTASSRCEREHLSGKKRRDRRREIGGSDTSEFATGNACKSRIKVRPREGTNHRKEISNHIRNLPTPNSQTNIICENYKQYNHVYNVSK